MTAGFVGSHRYSSLTVSRGFTPSRRDDCESVIYMLAEMGTGDLPWSKTIGGPNMAQLVMQAKESTTPDQIANGMPNEFRLLF